eukprot:3963137-Pleurochrysis_carterae.AAC.1
MEKECVAICARLGPSRRPVFGCDRYGGDRQTRLTHSREAGGSRRPRRVRVPLGALNAQPRLFGSVALGLVYPDQAHEATAGGKLGPVYDRPATVAFVVVDFGFFCAKPCGRVRRHSLFARLRRIGDRSGRESATRGSAEDMAMCSRGPVVERGGGRGAQVVSPQLPLEMLRSIGGFKIELSRGVVGSR